MQESRKNTFLSGKRNNSFDLMDAEFIFHKHKYFSYEKDLARREINSVLNGKITSESNDSIKANVSFQGRTFEKLTYFSKVKMGSKVITTKQYLLEQGFRDSRGHKNRQATRYSVHGIHEYKGKFNPQLARFILNYFDAKPGSNVLDPFCGSGTTLIECAYQKINAVGVDMNPLAVFLTKAKHLALAIDPDVLEEAGVTLIEKLEKPPSLEIADDDLRMAYLLKWFSPQSLQIIEHFRKTCLIFPETVRHTLLALGSDLVRNYSLQEPSDLRIRRRSSPFPTISFQAAFKDKLSAFCNSIRSSQSILGKISPKNKVICGDARALSDTLSGAGIRRKFDFVVTSPPYATALPYIDTQRLSLVWLELCTAKGIAALDADAVGSRELRGLSKQWSERLFLNTDNLPDKLATFCRKLQKAVSATDGFRRKVAPQLIYRYYAQMLQVFEGLDEQLKPNSKLGFVVGSNHTTLGGKRFVIDTPADLALIAEQCGFNILEVIKLDTYQRYGLHSKNAINSENLTIFEKSRRKR